MPQFPLLKMQAAEPGGGVLCADDACRCLCVQESEPLCVQAGIMSTASMHRAENTCYVNGDLYAIMPCVETAGGLPCLPSYK